MIKKLISKLFGIKQCACPEDEHIEYYTKVPEPEIPVHEEPKWKCGTHNRYKIFYFFNHAVTVTGPADADPPPPVSVILDVVAVAKV